MRRSTLPSSGQCLSLRVSWQESRLTVAKQVSAFSLQWTKVRRWCGQWTSAHNLCHGQSWPELMAKIDTLVSPPLLFELRTMRTSGCACRGAWRRGRLLSNKRGWSNLSRDPWLDKQRPQNTVFWHIGKYTFCEASINSVGICRASQRKGPIDWSIRLVICIMSTCPLPFCRLRGGGGERERERERKREREKVYCVINQLIITTVREQIKQTNRNVPHWLCNTF